jgi:hypothetical protein
MLKKTPMGSLEPISEGIPHRNTLEYAKRAMASRIVFEKVRILVKSFYCWTFDQKLRDLFVDFIKR